MLKKLKIENFDDFVRRTRRVAFEAPFKLAKKLKLARQATEEDIEKIISFKEVKLLILDQFVEEHTDEYVVINSDYETCSKILDSVINRLVNNELTKMASEGELECYFDSDINDFRFQIKQQEE